MTRKPRLSPQYHADMGRALAAIRDELARRTTQLRNAYPQTGREAIPARKLAAAVTAIGTARNDLDNALFREHPAEATTTAYYPNPEDRTWSPSARGSGPPPSLASATCPACSASAYYFRELDRYVHADGSGNFSCWLAIGRGAAPTLAEVVPLRAAGRPALARRRGD
ncbi:hypothetical protein [Streptomyces sp. NBC_01373]|uniref:hypothetical protein n=1 Tax=Streptomyces sp. NBC_01373 TaxID=2903843 RepID=UPI002252C68A|nr:hypothetical protein [Streptomyces sp. NBC_01373]MCX4699527.1 hypothetical protein [Streptomyces sp. NBC_01373]